MARIFIIMFIVFIVLGLAAIIHGIITAPTLDEDTNRFVHWKKAKAYFKEKWEREEEQAVVVEEKIAKTLLAPMKVTTVTPKRPPPSRKMKPLPQVLNKDGSVRKRPGPKLGSHNRKK
jgi:hypothetical protein